MSTVTCPEVSMRGWMTPLTVSTRIESFVVSPWSRTKRREAARAVAALLDLVAVAVSRCGSEVGVGHLWLLHQQDLVAADSEMAIRDAPHLSPHVSAIDWRTPSITTKSFPPVPASW
jgi:hypothetical protein